MKNCSKCSETSKNQIFVKRTGVSATESHVTNEAPLIGLGIESFNALSDRWAVVSANGIQYSIENANASAASSCRHFRDWFPLVLLGIITLDAGQTLTRSSVVTADL